MQDFYLFIHFLFFILDNRPKGNGDKCHALLITKKKVITNVDSAQIENSHSEKLLGVIIYNNQIFEEHIKK